MDPHSVGLALDSPLSTAKPYSKGGGVLWSGRSWNILFSSERTHFRSGMQSEEVEQDVRRPKTMQVTVGNRGSLSMMTVQFCFEGVDEEEGSDLFIVSQVVKLKPIKEII